MARILIVLAVVGSACVGSHQLFQRPSSEQRLPSGRVVQVTSCLLAWGGEHDERRPDQDAFVLEYVTALPLSAAEELDREALEVFELIRAVSERWGFSSASVAAFPTAERSGPYQVFAFSRSSDGVWSFTRQQAKVFNTPSGHKPGHP